MRAGSLVRWLLIPPAALAGWVVAQVAVQLVTLFMPWPIVSRMAGSLATPAGFVLLGARAAPSRHVQVAGGLTALMLVVHGMAWGIVLLGGRFGVYGGTELVELSAAVILGILGAVLGCFVVYRQRRGRPPDADRPEPIAGHDVGEL